jgi:hypothetical protein
LVTTEGIVDGVEGTDIRPEVARVGRAPIGVVAIGVLLATTRHWFVNAAV